MGGSNAPAPREVLLIGDLREERVRSGVRRGRFGLFQRRVRASVFGEPLFEAELVYAEGWLEWTTLALSAAAALAWLAWAVRGRAAAPAPPVRRGGRN